MLPFVPAPIPRNPDECPQWLHETLKRLNRHATEANQSFSAIVQGYTPDNSGNSLVDLVKFFYKPGIAGGQTAYGGTNSGDPLLLSSTAASAKGLIYLGTSLVNVFDEVNSRLGLGTATPAQQIHLYKSSAATGQMGRIEGGTFTVSCTTTINNSTVGTAAGNSFAPTGGPRVVPGMFVSGTGITAGTRVKTVVTGSSLTLTANATATNNPVTLTFQAYLDLGVVNDESGFDQSLTTYSGLRIIAGTGTTAPLRISGDTVSLATNAAAVDLAYIEVGTVSAGVATGTNLQLGGSGLHGDLSLLNIRAVYTRFDDPASGSAPLVAISTNPQEFDGGGGTALKGVMNFIMTRTATSGLVITAGSTSTNAMLMCVTNAAISGTSPNRSFSATNFTFKVTEDKRVWVGDGSGNGFYLNASTNNMQVFDGGTNLNLFSAVAGVTSWSDSAVSEGFYLGALTGTSAKRSWFSSAGNGVMDRVGVSSLYTLIASERPAGASFAAPSANPEVLHVVSGATDGNNASIVLSVETKRTGHTANLISAISAVTGNTTFAVDNKAFLQASIKSSSFLVDSTDLTKKIALDLTRITTATTRTVSYTDTTGYNVLDANSVFDGLSGDVMSYNGDMVVY